MIGLSLQEYCRGKTPFPLKEKTHFSLSPGTRFEFIEASVFAVFGNCGQDCCARSRLLVQRSVYDEFVERFAQRTAALHVGQPLDEQSEVGPLISAGQRQRSLDYLALGQKVGAQVLIG